jgi:transducin (beta)-like 1
VALLPNIIAALTSTHRASFDCTARLWDSITGVCIQLIEDHKRPLYALSFSPNGRLLSTGSGDGWMYIYSVKVT